MNKDIKRIESWNPCVVGLRWAEKQSSLKKVWDKCEDAEWLFFICQAEKALNLKKEQSVAIAIAVASRVLTKFESACPDDNRPRKAIETAQAWLDNPTEENVVAAALAARQAASATGDAVYFDACDAAFAANPDCAAYAAAAYAAVKAVNATRAGAVYAVYAAFAAAHAAGAAGAANAARATHAATDVAADATYDAAHDAERKAQADIFRSIVPNPFKQQTKE